ncbi:hypothetical protein BJG93_36905 (plasmid) [Paraburkholderia sprentiae WSM5005]|uniref:Uncharacterized protein n=1 Tax=Paraburkholderia sprentiae WSM5005 TaxID=754502 RepID=A0A8F4KIM5_9BURK|nr:hypothetical protein [Paraburkholderia sprentiae]QXE07447.1 hypothetical protein BJG93_36905 [Paraburkholderia sprentiae WSM5005]
MDCRQYWLTAGLFADAFARAMLNWAKAIVLHPSAASRLAYAPISVSCKSMSPRLTTRLSERIPDTRSISDEHSVELANVAGITCACPYVN